MKIQEFDFSVDLLQSVLWQDNTAENLQAILAKKQAWYTTNQHEFWSSWFTNVFNLLSANDFGLAVWSIILNLPLFIGATPDPPGKPVWGFGPEDENFENGNFSNNSGSPFNLTTEEKRLILRLRYFKLISRGGIIETNRFFSKLFANDGPAYILDGQDMTIVAVFLFPISSRVLYLMELFDLIPRCAGVKIRYRVITELSWGFGEFNENFENGSFLGSGE